MTTPNFSALGTLPAAPEPVLTRADFIGWPRDSLETLTLDLLAENVRMRADIRLLLDAHRAALVSISAGLDATVESARGASL